MEERKFIAAARNCSWREVMATSAEMAYRKIASDYLPMVTVYILDPMEHRYDVFTRKLDKFGNLIEIGREGEA